MTHKKAEAELDLDKLAKLLADATRGPWHISRGIMGDGLNITAYEREGFPAGRLGRKDGDGPICHVSKERHHFEHDRDHFGNAKGESRSWKTPIHKAEADAQLIVAAVNALPELLKRAGMKIDETAWLIEWPADRHGPIRYYSPAEAPVISHDDALRFARKKDAEAVIRAEHLRGCAAVEHMWMAPAAKKAKAA